MSHKALASTKVARRQAAAFPVGERLAVGMAEAAGLIGVTIETMRHWRKNDLGPAGFRVGTRVLYRVADLEAFLDDAQARDRAKRGGAA